MSLPDLSPKQTEEAERIYQALRPACDAELRRIAQLLASKPDHQLLGKTEFEVRDRVHTLGAKAIETALNERKKGATKVPVGVARPATDPASSRAAATRPSSASWARSCSRIAPTTSARPVTKDTSPSTRRWDSPPAD